MEDRSACWRCHGQGWFEKSNRPGVRVDCKRCKEATQRAAAAAAENERLRKGRAAVRVGVVGAGIGGCAAALALARMGFRVLLLERDRDFGQRKQGYGLTLQQGFHAMRFLQLSIPQDTPSTSHFAFDERGKILGYFGSNFSRFFAEGSEYSRKTKGKFSGSGRFNMHIPRQHLRYMLWKAIQDEALPVEVRWDARVAAVCASGSGVEVQLEAGAREQTDFVVAADGIYSTLRQTVLGDPLCYLGCVVVLGIAPLSHPLTHERVCETMDGETRIYSMPFTSANPEGHIETDPALRGKESVMWQLSFPVASEEEARRISASPGSLKAEALRRCGAWHAPIPELLQSTDLGLLSGHPVFDRAELDPAGLEARLEALGLAGRVLLVGDAAHPMSPFKGQGANQALLDATDLAKAAASPAFLDAAARPGLLTAVQRTVAERSATKVRGSREAARLLHTPLAKEEAPEQDRALEEAGVSAATPDNLNERVVAACGYGHRPHLLHQVKVDRSRNAD